MRFAFFASGLAALIAWQAGAQTTSFTPGKIAVLRGGDGVITISSGRQHPIFIDEYDPALTNQASPIVSLELPTNGANGIFMNAHAGSEGQAFTRSSDRRYLAVSAYCGDINSIPGTPSSATNAGGAGYPRGFGLVDASGNFSVTYSSPEWFGIEPGLSQNNPRGIATDGSNDFWGCGTIAGTQTGGFSETGSLFWNGSVSSDPLAVQSIVQSAYYMKIINNVLYMVCQTDAGGAQNNGVYNFVDFAFNGGAPIPLPFAPNNVQHAVETNLFINFGTTYANIRTFDMNPAGTIAYAADTTFGIVKFVNSGGTWTTPYLFNSNNIGSGVGLPKLPKGSTGCYGVAVDFSQTNPVIYATTMDEGDGANTCSNRLIAIVDTGVAPNATNIIAKTLAVANGINEVFRGLDFTPDLTPQITQQPAGESVLTGETVTLNVGAQSPFPLTYIWQDNGTNLANGGNISGANTGSLTLSSLSVTNSGGYTVIVSNQYGAVTSMVAQLDATTTPLLPSITNAVVRLTNFIGNNQSFAIVPQGTFPFSYQWYFGNSQLTDDGVKYNGSASGALTITNLQLSDSGSYYLTVSNQGGGISNLIAVLTVQYQTPSIGGGGQPNPITVLQGQTASFTVFPSGTQPLTYHWYAGNLAHVLSDAGEFSGTLTSNLVITGTSFADATNYFCVISNSGGGVTSQTAALTVLAAPALSYVAYTNQIYFQNFDALPNPGASNVNTIGGGGPLSIGGVTYEVANPFDFAYPLFTNVTLGASGGLNQPSLAGWYGECDVDTTATGGQLGAADGSTTTGGIYSFGPTNGVTSNRALGLISTSTSGGAHFGLKLINTGSNALNYLTLQFTGEFWKTGTKPKTMVFNYNIDSAGNNSTLSQSELLASSNNPVAALTFSFPKAGIVGPTNGLLAVNQTNCAVTNMPLSAPWAPGSALWLIWSIDDPTGSGQGYGIDNLSLYAGATTNLTAAQAPVLMNPVYSAGGGLSFNFTTAPGAAASMTVHATTNLALPLAQWMVLGNPMEVSFGHYQFTDSAQTNSALYYTVTSP